jgi:ribosomal protein S12 methylthiotransferase accessory factor
VITLDKLSLSRAFSVIYEQDGIIFRSDLETFEVRGQSSVELIRHLLAACDGQNDHSAIVASLSEFGTRTVESLLGSLISKGVILSGLEEKTGWNGQSDFLRLWVALDTLNAISQSRIVIAGDEPWGRIAAASLVKAGVRRIHFVDGGPLISTVSATFDSVDVSESGSADRDLIPEGSWDLIIGTWHRDEVKRLLRLARECHLRRLRSLFTTVDGLTIVFGPLVYPGETACWNCARQRQLRNSSHFEEDLLLDRHVLSGFDVSRKRQTIDPIAAVAGNGLALEVIKSITAYTLSDLGGRIIVQNMVSLETTRHTILRDPTCSVCGDVPPTPRMEPMRTKRALDPLPQDAEELKEFLSDYVDSRSGIVRHLFIVRGDVTEPELPIAATAILARTIRHSGDGSQELGSGKGLTPSEALMGAFGEAVERYSAAICKGHEIRRATADELVGEHMDPRCLCLYSDEQYATHDFHFVRYEASLKIDWVAGQWLDSGGPVWIPALPVFFNYHAPAREQFCQVTSNGLACGMGFEDAAFRAVCELIERDAFVTSWLCRTPASAIALQSELDAPMLEIVRQFQEHAVAFEAYLLNGTPPITSVLSIAIGDGDEWPATSAALGAHWDPHLALRKSILELGHVTPYVRRLMRNSSKHPSDPRQVHSLTDHALYYSRPNRLRNLDFIRSLRGAPVRFPPADFRASDVRSLGRALAQHGIRVAIVDVTSPDLASGPFRVVRAIGVNVQQIHFGFGLDRLGNPRLQARLKGKRPNPDPHPLA